MKPSGCEVNVNDDMGVFTEIRACGHEVVAEVCPRRGRVYEACAKHAWEASDNDVLVGWAEGIAPPRPGYDDEDES